MNERARPIAAPWASLFLCGCGLCSLFISAYRFLHPEEVPLVTHEGGAFRFSNPAILEHGITVEQYAAHYGIDPLTVRAMCLSGQIKGTCTYEAVTRQWIIPGEALGDMLTVSDVAARQQVAERTVRDWIAAGRIHPQPVKIAREWHIPRHYRLDPPKTP